MKTYSIEFECFDVTEPVAGGMKDLHIAYFSSESEAKKYVQMTDKGWPKNIRRKDISHHYIVLDTVEEKEQHDIEMLKIRALAKLTPQEIKALGLEK